MGSPIIGVGFLVLLVACTNGSQFRGQVSPTSSREASSPGRDYPATYDLSGVQAQAVTTISNFIDAFNTGRQEDALALLSSDFRRLTDCDFRTGALLSLVGNSQAAEWLRARLADHDLLELAGVSGRSPQLAPELQIDLARRRSDLLLSVRSRDGSMTPPPARAVLTTSGDRLVELGFAATAAQCHPDRVFENPSADATTFQLSAYRVRQVATIMNFLTAYNARRLEAALALMDDSIGSVGDCNYRDSRGILYKGKSGAAQWLQERFADHDRITVGTVWNHSGSPPAGVDWARRSNDTLRSLGFAEGIKPALISKIQFTPEGHRLVTFGFSNVRETGEPRGECRPAR